jgi:hypothetical protein
MEEGWVRAERKYELNFLLRMDYLETSYDSVHHDEVSICGCKRSCKSGDGNLLLPNAADPYRLAYRSRKREPLFPVFIYERLAVVRLKVW